MLERYQEQGQSCFPHCRAYLCLRLKRILFTKVRWEPTSWGELLLAFFLILYSPPLAEEYARKKDVFPRVYLPLAWLLLASCIISQLFQLLWFPCPKFSTESISRDRRFWKEYRCPLEVRLKIIMSQNTWLHLQRTFSYTYQIKSMPRPL